MGDLKDLSVYKYWVEVSISDTKRLNRIKEDDWDKLIFDIESKCINVWDRWDDNCPYIMTFSSKRSFQYLYDSVKPLLILFPDLTYTVNSSFPNVFFWFGLNQKHSNILTYRQISINL